MRLCRNLQIRIKIKRRPQQIKTSHKDLQECKLCDISRLKINMSGEGLCLGKLTLNHKFKRLNTKTVLFVGLAPSCRRFDPKLRAFETLETCCAANMKTSGGVFHQALIDSGFYYYNVYMTNLIKCSTENNRLPKKKEISNCMKWLNLEIQSIKPDIIIALGNTVYSELLKKSVICNKVMHPAYCLRIKSKYFKLVSQLRGL